MNTDIFVEEETTLRKIKANKHLENSISILYYTGLWPEKAKHKRLYDVSRACGLIFLFGVIVVSEIIFVIVNLGNLDLMLAGATLLMTNSTHAAKVIYIIYRHKQIKDLVDITKSEMFSRDNDKYERIITHYTWQGIFHHIAYQTFGGIAVISWGCIPIRNMILGISKQLPMAGWYPYNVTITPAYEITCLHQFVMIFIGCINNVAIDTFITGLLTTACCQLKLLNCNIASMDCVTENEDVLSNTNVEKSILKSHNLLYESLKLCIEHSKMIFDFSKEIQDMFGVLIFSQLLVNCIIVCLVAFNISQMKVYVPVDLCGMLMYMCCMSYQIFIYCWHGNELYLHSLNICFSAYANNWWNNSKKFKQALLVIMMRAQSPLILTVGNIMDLSLQNFVLILRTSYSIFTVLKSSTAA